MARDWVFSLIMVFSHSSNLPCDLKRLPSTRGGSKKPVLSDLRESGAIEQDADIVMFIYRPAYYGMLDEGDDKAADVIIAKHRAGEVGEVRLNFIPQFVRFETAWLTEAASLWEKHLSGQA